MVLRSARTCVGSRRSGVRGSPGGYRDGADARSEFEIAGRECVERSLVLEKDDLAIGLTTRLRADAELIHRRLADEPSPGVDATIAMRATDHESAFADGRKHGVAVALGEKRLALPGVPEQFDRTGIVVIGPCRAAHERQKQANQNNSHESCHDAPPGFDPLLRLLAVPMNTAIARKTMQH